MNTLEWAVGRDPAQGHVTVIENGKRIERDLDHAHGIENAIVSEIEVDPENESALVIENGRDREKNGVKSHVLRKKKSNRSQR